MTSFDDQNVALIADAGRNDATRAVAAFYDCFPYERRPERLDYPAEPAFSSRMVNQELGFWGTPIVPNRPDIWIAGSGPIQAVVTALRFPNARIVASDISARSLELTQELARELRIDALTVRQESILDAPYSDEFDVVFSTGVAGSVKPP